MEGNRMLLIQCASYLCCSGRASSLQSLSMLKDRGYSLTNPIPDRHALNVTVPGAVAGWIDTINKHGSGKVRFTVAMA